VPFYLRRTVEAYPQRTPLMGLSLGFGTICRVLPVGSAVTQFAVNRLAARAEALLASNDPRDLGSGLEVVRLLAETLLAVDHEVMPLA
jgi:hypothetical protein